MKICSMHLENYRCFESFDIEFDDQLTVLVGVNGSGKTALLDAVAVFLEATANMLNNRKDNLLFEVSDLKLGAEKGWIEWKIKEDGLPEKIVPTLRSHSGCCPYPQKLKNHYRKIRNSSSALLPVMAFYSAKRILDSKGVSKGAKANAFKNAFSLSIDFPASRDWFIEKANEEGRSVKRSKDVNYSIPELDAVRGAISQALGDYDEPYVDETPPQLYITKKGKPNERYDINQLSDGYRTMLALVMDLARRMAVANEHVDNWPKRDDGKDGSVLDSPGIVLIDEVELHLHPSWQQTVLPKLMEIFPKVQFIVTTHSPQVLTTVAVKHIRVLKDGQSYTINDETEGAEPSRLLKDVLGVDSLRPKQNKWVQKLNEYRELVYKEQWDDPHAIGLRQELGKHFTDADPELMQLDLHVENSKWERGL